MQSDKTTEYTDVAAHEGEQHMIFQNVIVGVQDVPPQNMQLWFIDYFELWALEKWQMQTEAYLPKDRSSTRK